MKKWRIWFSGNRIKWKDNEIGWKDKRWKAALFHSILHNICDALVQGGNCISKNIRGIKRNVFEWAATEDNCTPLITTIEQRFYFTFYDGLNKIIGFLTWLFRYVRIFFSDWQLRKTLKHRFSTEWFVLSNLLYYTVQFLTNISFPTDRLRLLS